MSLPLSSSFPSHGLEYALRMSSLPGRVICGVLIIFSVCSWTVMLMKLFRMSRWNRANTAFLHVFRHASHPLAVFQSSEHYELAPYYHIYHKSSRELAFQLAGVDLPDKTFATRLQGSGRITPSQMSSVHAALDRSVGDAALKLEARMSVVAVALSGAPFIGLLGTVWGVMDSLAALAESGTPATLPAMAPGLCTAMLTTLAGLLVAVPSLLGYNFRPLTRMIAQRRAGSRDLRLIAEISVTPVVSLVLVLLLAFLVALPLMQNDSTAASAPPAEAARLTVDASHSLKLDGEAVSRNELKGALQKLHHDKPGAGVLVQIPGDLPAQFLVGLMESMKQAGISKTAVTTAADN